MPKHAIESPRTSSTVDRLTLTSQHVRDSQPSSAGNCCCWSFCGCFEAEVSAACSGLYCFEAEGSNYNLCGGCAQGMVGCFEPES